MATINFLVNDNNYSTINGMVNTDDIIPLSLEIKESMPYKTPLIDALLLMSDDIRTKLHETEFDEGYVGIYEFFESDPFWYGRLVLLDRLNRINKSLLNIEEILDSNNSNDNERLQSLLWKDEDDVTGIFSYKEALECAETIVREFY